MSLIDLFRRRGKKPTDVACIPPVKFDASRVTPAIRTDIRATISALPDIPANHQASMVDAAILSVRQGRNLAGFTGALQQIGIDRKRAGEIALIVHNRASVMQTTSSQNLGIRKAKWLHSGAPCFHRMAGMERIAAAHAAASGKTYVIASGLRIEGVQAWPGREAGCKCAAVPIIPGIKS